MFVVVICVFLVQLQLLALTWFLHLCRFPDRTFSDVIPYLRLDHREELEDLFDPIKEENLLQALGYKRFRREQSKRIHLAQEVIAQRAHNCRIFQEWGDTECERAITILNSEAGERAKALVDVCLYYRLNTCMVQGRLYAWCLRMALLGFIRSPLISRLRRMDSFDVIDSYNNVEQAAEALALACGDECRHVLVRTLHTVREGATDAAWISEPKILGGRP